MKQVRSITAETHDFMWKIPPMQRGKSTGVSQQHFSLLSRVWVTTPYGGLQESNGVNPNRGYMYWTAGSSAPLPPHPQVSSGAAWWALWPCRWLYSGLRFATAKVGQPNMNLEHIQQAVDLPHVPELLEGWYQAEVGVHHQPKAHAWSQT